MADKIQWAGNTMPKSDDKHLGIMSLDHVKKARAFHQSFPQYTVTPLARLDGQAARLGLSNLCVKDESYRFGLNAFKVLGGSFAMANYIADETGKDVSECTFDYLTSDQLAKDFGQATFFTATDGNHGRGVAALIDACARYYEATGRRISFEYAMIDGVNDTPEHARLLAKHARRVCAHVNLIPLNHVEERAFRPSTPEHLKAFIRILEQAGVNVTVRRKLGSDVDASCGQLRKKVADHRA